MKLLWRSWEIAFVNPHRLDKQVMLPVVHLGFLRRLEAFQVSLILLLEAMRQFDTW